MCWGMQGSEQLLVLLVLLALLLVLQLFGSVFELLYFKVLLFVL